MNNEHHISANRYENQQLTASLVVRRDPYPLNHILSTVWHSCPSFHPTHFSLPSSSLTAHFPVHCHFCQLKMSFQLFYDHPSAISGANCYDLLLHSSDLSTLSSESCTSTASTTSSDITDIQLLHLFEPKQIKGTTTYTPRCLSFDFLTQNQRTPTEYHDLGSLASIDLFLKSKDLLKNRNATITSSLTNKLKSLDLKSSTKECPLSIESLLSRHRYSCKRRLNSSSSVIN